MSNIIPYNELQSIGKAMAESGYFSDARGEAQAIVKVLAGNELGIGPFASMTGIHVIKGKPVMGANLIASLIKNDPRYNYRVTEHTEKVCAITFYENGSEIGESRITIQELQQAGSQNLQKYPKNMLFARAISNGVKWHTPGIFGGAPVYTPDEFDLEVDEEGDVIAGVAVEVQPDPPPSNGTNGSAPEPTGQPAEQRTTKLDQGAPLQWMIDMGYAENMPNASGIANLLELGKVRDRDEQINLVDLYRKWRNAGAETDVAATHAKAGNTPEVEEPA